MGARHEPERTCVGCRGKAPKGLLLRFGLVDGAVLADPSGRAPGRGAYVHRDPDCLRLALRRGAVARALRTGLAQEEVARLVVDIERIVET